MHALHVDGATLGSSCDAMQAFLETAKGTLREEHCWCSEPIDADWCAPMLGSEAGVVHTL